SRKANPEEKEFESWRQRMGGIAAGVCEHIGMREAMEDAHAVRDRPGCFSAEVFDGHYGPLAARTAAAFLIPCFWSLHSREAKKPDDTRRSDMELLRDAYMRTDEAILARGIMGGTTAATLLLLGTRFLAANVGDARIVIGTAGGSKLLTMDHRPELPEEMARIESLGGRVMHLDIPRVQGELAISRALGDAHLKPYVSAEPRIVEGWLGRENDWAVLATDGIWDVITPAEAILASRESSDPQEAAELIVSIACWRGAHDNMTVIVLDLRGCTRELTRSSMEISAIHEG
ncbi:MAG TPA: PP2C family protein-serine/threonine phosphatase, partial [Methanothrix sp.]